MDKFSTCTQEGSPNCKNISKCGKKWKLKYGIVASTFNAMGQRPFWRSCTYGGELLYLWIWCNHSAQLTIATCLPCDNLMCVWLKSMQHMMPNKILLGGHNNKSGGIITRLHMYMTARWSPWWIPFKLLWSDRYGIHTSFMSTFSLQCFGFLKSNLRVLYN